MIEKERLEEFIQNKTVIYNIAKGQDGTRWLRTLDVNDIIDIEEKFIYYVPDEYPEIANFSDLFETKEDAEFALRFQNILRTEELNLPTFEEFCKNTFFAFTAYNYRYALCIDYDGSLVVGEYDEYENYFPGEEINYGELTKENYLKACELCRKLYLGEVE